jgi:hypothetical protein
MSRALFTFPTTDMAIWAEETALGEGIPAELVPAPPGSEALCDLALETFARHADRLTSALEATGVDFSRWSPVPSPPRSHDGRPAAGA